MQGWFGLSLATFRTRDHTDYSAPVESTYRTDYLTYRYSTSHWSWAATFAVSFTLLDQELTLAFPCHPFSHRLVRYHRTGRSAKELCGLRGGTGEAAGDVEGQGSPGEAHLHF